MQSATENVFVYVARQSYKGTGKNDPSFEVNDVIHVTADFLHRQNINPESPDGWLLGKNVRTGQEGYFPGRCWHCVSIHYAEVWEYLLEYDSCRVLFFCFSEVCVLNFRITLMC